MKQYPKNNFPVVKVVAPIFDDQEENSQPFEIFAREEKVANLRFSRQILDALNKPYLSINNCVFSHTQFHDCQFKQAQITDVRFENCDLSNISFASSTFYRVEFIACKLLGTNFPETTLNHVLMEGCNGQYINLAMSKLRTARFADSDFRNGSFNDSKLIPAAFDGCQLIEADFSHTSLKGIDLRTSRISGIQLNLADLRGAMVSSLQAMDLLPLLSVTIKD